MLLRCSVVWRHRVARHLVITAARRWQSDNLCAGIAAPPNNTALGIADGMFDDDVDNLDSTTDEIQPSVPEKPSQAWLRFIGDVSITAEDVHDDIEQPSEYDTRPLESVDSKPLEGGDVRRSDLTEADPTPTVDLAESDLISDDAATTLTSDDDDLERESERRRFRSITSGMRSPTAEQKPCSEPVEHDLAHVEADIMGASFAGGAKANKPDADLSPTSKDRTLPRSSPLPPPPRRVAARRVTGY